MVLLTNYILSAKYKDTISTVLEIASVSDFELCQYFQQYITMKSMLRNKYWLMQKTRRSWSNGFI